MALAENTNFEKLIRDAMTTALKKSVTERYEFLRKELIEKLDREKDEVIAGITLNLMSHVSFERIGADLRISIESKSFKSEK